MKTLQPWAQPWWVNLLLAVPVLASVVWRRKGLRLTRGQLTICAVFGIAFGFVEAAVVVYLRAAIGLLPDYAGTLSDLRRAAQNPSQIYVQAQSIAQFPQSLLTIEVFREAATILMLLSVAMLGAPKARERWALFLWTFALWDSAYYAGLWCTVRWPASLCDLDVLFLIPVPWLAQVWFPLLVSALTLLAVVLTRSKDAA
jgi:hypothetical protein